MTTVHMSHFITKCMSNTLTNMAILQLKGNKTTNLCPCCGVDTETTQHLCQCTHSGNRGIKTVSVDALRKCLEAWNMDPDITIILADTLLYIEGERNDVTQYPKLTLHSDILHTIWLSIILGIILTSLARTQQTYFTRIGRGKRD